MRRSTRALPRVTARAYTPRAGGRRYRDHGRDYTLCAAHNVKRIVTDTETFARNPLIRKGIHCTYKRNRICQFVQCTIPLVGSLGIEKPQ